MSKPTVFYKLDGLTPVVGSQAYVVISKHHALQDLTVDSPVTTSRVISYDPVTGVFETRNTIYAPAK